MTFPQTITASQANKETPIGEMFADLAWAALGSHNPATTSGLTFGVNGGTKLIDGVLTTIADQTTLLDASTTNYVEWTRAGVLSDNPTGFTAGREPLYVVTTSASGVASFVDSRTWGNHPGVAGRTSVAVTTADVTLTAAQARCNIINATGALTGNRAIIVPNGPQTWTVTNNTTGAFTLTVKTSGGSGVVVTQGKAADVLADGTNVILSNNDTAAAGGVTSVDASGGVQTVAGTPITGVGAIRAAEVFNAQTGTNYTVLTGDRGKLVTLSNAAAIAVTLPQAGANFPDGWYVDVKCIGAGTATITPTTSTIDGAASVALTTGQSFRIVSDGTNYRTVFNPATGGSRVGLAFEKELALSDLTTAITTGTTKAYFRPAFAATGVSARASLRVASSSGLPTVDVNKNAVTMMSTKLTIDASELTSQTAAVPVVMSVTTWAIDDLIEFDIDVAGTGAMGLIVTVTGLYA